MRAMSQSAQQRSQSAVYLQDHWPHVGDLATVSPQDTVDRVGSCHRRRHHDERGAVWWGIAAACVYGMVPGYAIGRFVTSAWFAPT